MKLKLNPCPNCGCMNRQTIYHILTRKLPWGYCVEGDNCHYCGKTKLFLKNAKRAWNKEYHGIWGDKENNK